jgi:hypothetical protein
VDVQFERPLWRKFLNDCYWHISACDEGRTGTTETINALVYISDVKQGSSRLFNDSISFDQKFFAEISE